MKRGGSADLPLHYGTVPKWLADRMMILGTSIIEAIITDGGTDEGPKKGIRSVLVPGLRCCAGDGWTGIHTGITTSVMRAIQRGLNPRSSELGIAVLGGPGKIFAKYSGGTARICNENRSVRRTAHPDKQAYR